MNALLGLSLGEWVMESDWSNYLGKLTRDDIWPNNIP